DAALAGTTADDGNQLAHLPTRRRSAASDESKRFMLRRGERAAECSLENRDPCPPARQVANACAKQFRVSQRAINGDRAAQWRPLPVGRASGLASVVAGYLSEHVAQTRRGWRLRSHAQPKLAQQVSNSAGLPDDVATLREL